MYLDAWSFTIEDKSVLRISFSLQRYTKFNNGIATEASRTFIHPKGTLYAGV